MTKDGQGLLNHHPLQWLAGFVCVVLSLASAGSLRAATEPRLVVDLGGQDADAALAHLRQAFGNEYNALLQDVPAALDRGFGPWTVSGPATLTACDHPALTADQLHSELSDIERLMQVLEYGEARSRLLALDERLCAATDPLAAESLGRIPFLVGIALFYSRSDDPEQARAWFRRAVERHPEIQWDPNFPPDPQELFMGAMGQVVRSSRVPMDVAPDDRPQQLIVDGTTIGVDNLVVTLVGTEHFIQIGDAEGAVRTLVLQTHGAERARLLGPARVAAGLAETPRTDAGAEAYAALQNAAQQRGHTVVLVLQEPNPDLAWRYDAIERRWACISLVMGRQLKNAKQARDIGGVMIGVGAAMAATGASIWGTNYQQGADLQSLMRSSRVAHDQLQDQYTANQRGATAGIAVLCAGAAVAIAGIPVAIHGTNKEKAAREDPRLGFAPSPDGVWLGVTGDW